MVCRRVASWTIGMVSILAALFLLASSVSISSVFLARIEKEAGSEYGHIVNVVDSRGLLTVRVNVINVGSRIELPVSNALVLIKMIENQSNNTITGLTEEMGVVSFRLPPGSYEVGVSYLGMEKNITINMTSEKPRMVVRWDFFRAPAKSFSLQLYDQDETGVIVPGYPVFAHLIVSTIEKPLGAEISTNLRQTSSRILTSSNRISFMKVVEYEQKGEDMWVTLTPEWNLPLTEINPSSNLYVTLYWLGVEVR